MQKKKKNHSFLHLISWILQPPSPMKTLSTELIKIQEPLKLVNFPPFYKQRTRDAEGGCEDVLDRSGLHPIPPVVSRLTPKWLSVTGYFSPIMRSLSKHSGTPEPSFKAKMLQVQGDTQNNPACLLPYTQFWVVRASFQRSSQLGLTVHLLGSPGWATCLWISFPS